MSVSHSFEMYVKVITVRRIKKKRHRREERNKEKFCQKQNKEKYKMSVKRSSH